MSKMKVKKIAGTPENWEKGLLGNSDEFAKVVDGVTAKELDGKLGLKPISIRLQQRLVDDLKFIAESNGLSGYQPLIRRVLKRFVDAEMKKIARDLAGQSNEDEMGDGKMARAV
ncbi:hypothetical protein LJ739_06660 [Aestuariibacter halophilus]|uniref:Uncharacterized protein n=1 Tax=Fluctibacter halophilus TaxID=226011 RepID=A0ABS8G5P3_9ALTE|nr:hypothetical protein [Aestuariibacter halophilus]MCC2615917.1 hypothetical protein [Aestuariibacter halophilus]